MLLRSRSSDLAVQAEIECLRGNKNTGPGAEMVHALGKHLLQCLPRLAAVDGDWCEIRKRRSIAPARRPRSFILVPHQRAVYGSVAIRSAALRSKNAGEVTSACSWFFMAIKSDSKHREL
jgi:hypothetical protein